MRRRITAVLIVALLGSMTGCLTFMNPMPEPACQVSDQLRTIPKECRSGVYVFMVNGNDPLHCANLKGVREYLSHLGFTRVYFGEISHEAWMAEELVCTNRDYPGSRFVVVGFEYGADSARRIAEAGLNRGATIDLLLYLEPRGSFYNLPLADAAIRRTVVVQNDKGLSTPAPLDNAEKIVVNTHTRYAVPTHPEVIDLLTNELTEIASAIPIIRFGFEPIPPLLDETAPFPRPLTEMKPQAYDEWDFLKLIVRDSNEEEMEDTEVPARPIIKTRQLRSWFRPPGFFLKKSGPCPCDTGTRCYDMCG